MFCFALLYVVLCCVYRILSLSYNRIYGTLPTSYVAAASYREYWPTLQHIDLSNNRVSGTLQSIARLYNYGPDAIDDDFAAAKLAVTNDVVYLGLHTNRLSGNIPLSMSLMPHIDILKGNVFQCSAVLGTTLPINDPSYSDYMCASDVLDISNWYIAITVMLVLLVLVALVSRNIVGYVKAFLWLCFDEDTSVGYFTAALRRSDGTPEAILALLDQPQYHLDNSNAATEVLNITKITATATATASAGGSNAVTLSSGSSKPKTTSDNTNAGTTLGGFSDSRIRLSIPPDRHRPLSIVSDRDISLLSALKLVSFVRFQVAIRRFAAVTACVIFIVLVPCYIILKTYEAPSGSGAYEAEDIVSVSGKYLYTTHTYQYGWRLTSGAFLQGYTPGVLVLALGGCILLGTNLLALWQQHYAKKTNIDNFVMAKDSSLLVGSSSGVRSSGGGSGSGGLKAVDSSADMTMVHDWMQNSPHDEDGVSVSESVSVSVSDVRASPESISSSGGTTQPGRVELQTPTQQQVGLSLPLTKDSGNFSITSNSNSNSKAGPSTANGPSDSAKPKSKSRLGPVRSWPRFFYLVLVVLLNGIVLISTNMMYVMVALNEGVSLVTAAAMGLILFKIMWNIKVIPAALGYQWQFDRLCRCCASRAVSAIRSYSIDGYHSLPDRIPPDTGSGSDSGYGSGVSRRGSRVSASPATDIIAYLVGVDATDDAMHQGDESEEEGGDRGPVPPEFDYLFEDTSPMEGASASGAGACVGGAGGADIGHSDSDDNEVGVENADGVSRLSGGSDLYSLRSGSVSIPRVSQMQLSQGRNRGNKGIRNTDLDSNGKDYLADQLTLRGTALMHTLLLIFNNVIAPILATMLVDGSCFSALVITPKEIDSTYSYPVCQQFNATSGDCMINEVSLSPGVNFTPPFIYSYQCSNSLLMQYVPMFVGLYGTVGIIVPFFQFLGMMLLRRKYGGESSSTTTTTTDNAETETEVEAGAGNTVGMTAVSKDGIHIDSVADVVAVDKVEMYERTSGVTEKLLPETSTRPLPPRVFMVELFTLGLISAIHWPLSVLVDQEYISITPAESKLRELSGHSVNTVNSGDRAFSRISTWSVGTIGASHHGIGIGKDKTNGEIAVNYWDKHTRYKVQSITCNIIAAIGVMITFGLLYPPLAILIAIYVCTNSLMLQYIITTHCRDYGRVRSDDCSGCSSDSDTGNPPVSVSNLPLLYQIAKECEGFTGILFYSFTYLTLFSFLYIGLFFLDVTSDMYTFFIPPATGVLTLVIVVVLKRLYSDRVIAELLHARFRN